MPRWTQTVLYSQGKPAIARSLNCKVSFYYHRISGYFNVPFNCIGTIYRAFTRYNYIFLNNIFLRGWIFYSLDQNLRFSQALLTVSLISRAFWTNTVWSFKIPSVPSRQSRPSRPVTKVLILPIISFF